MSVLVYGCTTKTLTKYLGGGARWGLNKDTICGFEEILETKQQLYSHLPPISLTIQERWARHAGYCEKSKDKLKKQSLWTPAYENTSVSQPAKT